MTYKNGANKKLRPPEGRMNNITYDMYCMYNKSTMYPVSAEETYTSAKMLSATPLTICSKYF